MKSLHLPALSSSEIAETKNALHAYCAVMGAWLKTSRPKRKHWWHASLRPTLAGLTSGVIHGAVDFELELNLRESLLQARTSNGRFLAEKVLGQPAATLAQSIQNFLRESGVDSHCIPQGIDFGKEEHTAYSAEQADKMGRAIKAGSAAMSFLRAGIPEETSPIQFWPHHFDLSMLWLPGEKIAGQNPNDEEYSDKQMNLGFTFGDEGIREPYFYVTAYPLPDEFSKLSLPEGTRWLTDGFSGAVLLYRDLSKVTEPGAYLIKLWTELLSAGREHMLDQKS